MTTLTKFLIGFHIFIGVGAIFGGLGAMIDPTGESMGISPDILKKGPFNDFLIPGLFLFIVIGIGNIIGAYTAFKQIDVQAYFTGGIGFILVMWIIIQCIILQDINILHIIFFIFGVIQCLIGLKLAIEKRLFPLNLIMKD